MSTISNDIMRAIVAQLVIANRLKMLELEYRVETGEIAMSEVEMYHEFMTRLNEIRREA
jgi:hypothetical protein